MKRQNSGTSFMIISWTAVKTGVSGYPMCIRAVFRRGETALSGCVVECTPFRAVGRSSREKTPIR